MDPVPTVIIPIYKKLLYSLLNVVIPTTKSFGIPSDSKVFRPTTKVLVLALTKICFSTLFPTTGCGTPIQQKFVVPPIKVVGARSTGFTIFSVCYYS